jgi:protein-L-isoaspartate O-methyltransferase
MTNATAELRRAMVDAVKAKGYLSEPAWEAAFREVPRHLFVPRVIGDWPGASSTELPCAADQDRPHWLEVVYSDRVLMVVDEDDRRSSSSTPSAMARFLDLLDVGNGTSVLEIGTGTGYNAALLCARLGAERVTSIDIDAELVQAAEAALANCGYRPTLAVADGALGYPLRAPYDRIIATCSVARIPSAWAAQLRPDGVMVTPLASGLLVSLRKQRDGALIGSADPMTVDFMRLRSPALPKEASWAPFGEKAEQGDVAAPQAWLLSQPVRFHARLLVPDVEIAFEDGDWSLASRLDGSWSRLRRHEDGDHVLAQGGPRRLWDLYLAAAEQWVQLGRPEASCYGLTVRPDGSQFLWLDSPDSKHRWEL